MKNRIVYMQGQPMALEGAQLKEKDRAPGFTLTGTDLKPVTMERFKDKVVILSCVPSLDTPVCSLETRRFNQEAAALGKDVAVVTVSKDLPFAQARWCAANGIENVCLLSDYKNQGFASDYGVFMPDMGLLARAVFVIDKQGIIQYIQFVEEVSNEPDYQTVLDKTRQILHGNGD